MATTIGKLIIPRGEIFLQIIQRLHDAGFPVIRSVEGQSEIVVGAQRWVLQTCSVDDLFDTFEVESNCVALIPSSAPEQLKSKVRQTQVRPLNDDQGPLCVLAPRQESSFERYRSVIKLTMGLCRQ